MRWAGWGGFVVANYLRVPLLSPTNDLPPDDLVFKKNGNHQRLGNLLESICGLRFLIKDENLFYFFQTLILIV